MEKTEKEYILSFSSFYKAAYAQEILEAADISSSLRKLPVELVRSCSAGLYLRTSSIQSVFAAFEAKDIVAKGVYEIRRQGKKREYHKV